MRLVNIIKESKEMGGDDGKANSNIYVPKGGGVPWEIAIILKIRGEDWEVPRAVRHLKISPPCNKAT